VGEGAVIKGIRKRGGTFSNRRGGGGIQQQARGNTEAGKKNTPERATIRDDEKGEDMRLRAQGKLAGKKSYTGQALWARKES